MPGSTQFDAFERLYKRREDPWHFASSPYEQAKYGVTLSYLRKDRYRRAFEPGCAEGVLTANLARRCNEVLAMDISSTAAERARRRCAPLTNVVLRTGDISLQMPDGHFDLIILSEIGYYFPKDLLRSITLDLARRLERDGEFIAVHWLGISADHTLTGDEVHEHLRAHLPLSWSRGERREGYRIDQWVAQ